ncbi:MAG: 4Fe-4S binding protein [Eubacteriales bacterium]|nr:4Fe-4S binding protein [Eubacteriales bacterium]
MAKLKLNTERCKGCGYCVSVCKKGALSQKGRLNRKGYDVVEADESLCVQCGMCYRMCPDYVFEILD